MLFLVSSPLQNNEDTKKREDAIMDLSQILANGKRTADLREMILIVRSFLASLGKAKAARMIRDLVDLCLKIDQDGDIKVSLAF